MTTNAMLSIGFLSLSLALSFPEQSHAVNAEKRASFENATAPTHYFLKNKAINGSATTSSTAGSNKSNKRDADAKCAHQLFPYKLSPVQHNKARALCEFSVFQEYNGPALNMPFDKAIIGYSYFKALYPLNPIYTAGLSELR